MKRWFRNWWTAHQVRLLLQYGTCPACRSSPPSTQCPVCQGFYDYGPQLKSHDRAAWAYHYINHREKVTT